MPITEADVKRRAKKLFEDDHPGDRRWGTNGKRVAFRMEIKEPNSPPIAILSPEERQRYMERALAELQAEETSKNGINP